MVRDPAKDPASDPASGPIRAGRSCAGCTMCCRLLGITELGKAPGQICPNECAAGCAIYNQRPESCRTFFCGYLVLPFAGEHWFPPESGMVVFPDAKAGRILVHVDPARPDAWQARPWYADLKAWAVRAEQMWFQVVVAVGRDMTAVLPSEDVALGTCEDEDRIVYRYETVGGRRVLRAARERVR